MKKKQSSWPKWHLQTFKYSPTQIVWESYSKSLYMHCPTDKTKRTKNIGFTHKDVLFWVRGGALNIKRITKAQAHELIK